MIVENKMILAIDVGLKNLAMCIMDCENANDYKTYDIKLWEVYNTLEIESFECIGLKKNGSICGKKCKYKYKKDNDMVYTCKTHFPKSIKINRTNNVKEKKVQDYLLQDITRTILLKLTDIYKTNKDIMDNVTKVIIELQPKVNNKMKLISHLIYGKFVELYIDRPSTTIRFISASNKLKSYKGPFVECNLKGAYAKRKYLSIKYTEWYLTHQFKLGNTVWIDKFNNNKKKDDLGDTFLMAINGLHYLYKV